jgi:membrane protease YdiL (CAAX protease family)
MFASGGNRSFWSRAQETFAAFAYVWLWVLFFNLLLQLSGLVASVPVPDTGALLGVLPNYILRHEHLTLKMAVSSELGWTLFGACVAAPFLEEIIFRGAVCSWASNDDGTIKPRGIWTILAGSFIIFGILHGQGLYSVMVQGVGGLIWANLWFRNGPSQRASYFSCVAAHALYNFSVVVTIALS